MAISTFIIPFIILVISYIYYSWIEIRNYDNSYSLQILSTDDSKRVRNQKNLLLVIAHPDDESMFFSPFLISLKERDDITVHVLCLSKCNDDSNVREEELKKACPILGIHEENIYFEDYVDGSDVCKKYFNFHYRLIMIIKWDPKDIADKISKHYNRLNVDIVVTFDYYGVSGHKNHIQCFNGVKNFKNNKGGKKFYKLLSSPIFLKYISFLAFPIKKKFSNSNLIFTNKYTNLTHNAMKQHYSQYVWFRKIYLIFSHYVYFNELVML